MLNKFITASFLVLISVFILKCNGDRIKDTMYIKINGSVACYRRMNSTHQIGCSSKRGGSIGIIHYCDTISDLDFILKNGSAGQYIPILPAGLYNSNTMRKLIENEKKVAGLILHPNNETLRQFTHENKCPNELFSFKNAQCPREGWNSWGTGLLYADIPFPLFYIENELEIITIKKCFQQFNNFSYSTQIDRSLCSLELKSFMFATTNTETCRRRSNIFSNLNPVKLCDPLGDSNIWASLFPLVKGPENETRPVKDFQYIVIAARLDTTSLFEKTAGAQSPVTGIVGLLTVAKLLKEMLPGVFQSENITKNVLFVLFNGETYDYIGSQRLLYDMEHGTFPTDLPANNDILPTIYPENITLFIELSQLTPGNATYAHYLGNSDSVTNFVDKLVKYGSTRDLFVSPTPNSLPPSSLHTFLRGNKSIKGIVMANHEIAYQNRFYNSLYDNASNIRYKYYNSTNIPDDTIQKYIFSLASVVANSVYEDITGRNYTGLVNTNAKVVDELLHCYLENPNCKLHKAIQKADLPKTPLSLYVGVSVVDNFITGLVALALAWFTGDIVDLKGPNCTNIGKNHVYRYYNMSVDMDQLDVIRCFRATVNITEAVSPAFIIEDYDWSSNEYSSWSESVWNDIGMRMFLKPAPAQERMTLALGSSIMIISFMVVYFMKSRSHILFDIPVIEDSPANC